MKKMIQKFWSNEKGFTLIELIIVIAILAIISAIAIPNILSAVDNSKKTADLTNGKVIADAAATARTTFTGAGTGEGIYLVSLTGIGDVAYAGTLGQAIWRQLNESAPVPKYKAEAAAASVAYAVQIDANGVITVYTCAGVTTPLVPSTAAITTGVEVYPNPHADYKTK